RPAQQAVRRIRRRNGSGPGCRFRSRRRRTWNYLVGDCSGCGKSARGRLLALCVTPSVKKRAAAATVCCRRRNVLASVSVTDGFQSGVLYVTAYSGGTLRPHLPLTRRRLLHRRLVRDAQSKREDVVLVGFRSHEVRDLRTDCPVFREACVESEAETEHEVSARFMLEIAQSRQEKRLE